MNEPNIVNYGEAIREGFSYLLSEYPEVFIIGQGLWSPWYVGNTMTDLDKKFGKDRIIDTPVSEAACTGAAVGASLAGMRPIIVHPRIDFMMYAIDPIVNQAAKWSHMTGGQAHPAVTIRGIINRGGEQGAQHSQALHSWFAHIPGLRVVMPSSVMDARDLLIASVLSNDPVMFIDDRWLYDQEDNLPPVVEQNLNSVKPNKILEGSDLTIVGSGYSSKLAFEVATLLIGDHINADVFDMRVINPLNTDEIITSVKKSGFLVVIDGGWKNCGFAGEIITSITEAIDPKYLKQSPKRFTLPDAPAPTSSVLEEIYYPSSANIYKSILKLLDK